MLTIRYSGDPPEAELAATPAEFAQLAEAIAGIAAGIAPEGAIVAESSDPAPYERCLTGLRVAVASGPLSVSVVGPALAISGAAGALHLLAHNLPVESGLPTGYHIHVEAAGRESWVSSQSVPLVLLVAGASDA